MSEDLLERATQALRSSTQPSADGADAVLERIERSRRTRKSFRRPLGRVIILPIAAAFVGGTALAAVGGKLSSWLPAPAAKTSAGAPPEMRRLPEIPRPGPVNRPMHSAPPIVEERKPVAAPAESAPAVVQGRPPARESVRAASPSAPVPANDALRSVTAPQTTAPEVAAPSSTAAVRAAYERAHEAHFVRRDFAAAVAAWDRYLSLAGPAGALVVEARYNRALALARSNRTSEAIRALEPFANAEYGRYRRDEARALIETLTR